MHQGKFQQNQMTSFKTEEAFMVEENHLSFQES